MLDDRGQCVPAEIGAGAWVVVLEQPVRGRRSPVCFRDARRVPVVAPLPAEWQRSPVSDSGEPCPACGAATWDLVIPADGSRGTVGSGGAQRPTPVIVCRVCGDEVVMGAVQRLAARDDEDPAVTEARVREMEERGRLSNEMTLRATTFSIFAARGIAGRLAGSGSSGDLVTRVTVSHGADDPLHHPNLQVETALTNSERHFSERMLASEALVRGLHDGLAGWSGDSAAAFVLKRRAQERARRQLAASATANERTIEVDGQPTTFTFIEAGSRWAAVARTGPLTITITATDIDPATVRLGSVQEPTKALI